MGQPVPVRHRPRPGRGRGRAGRPPRDRPLGAGRRRVDGRHARPGVGRDRTRSGSQRLLVLASTPYATGDQIAWCAPQLAAIRGRPGFRGGDYYDAAPGRARTSGWASPAGSPTSPTAPSSSSTCGSAATPQAGEQPLGGGGRYAVESYLDHHADKLVRRFDANSYVVLTEAMNSHDVGRGRGGVAAALRRVTARTRRSPRSTATGSTRSRCRRDRRGRSPAAAPLHVISSPYGHDGFLSRSARSASVRRARPLGADRAVRGRPRASAAVAAAASTRLAQRRARPAAKRRVQRAARRRRPADPAQSSLSASVGTTVGAGRGRRRSRRCSDQSPWSTPTGRPRTSTRRRVEPGLLVRLPQRGRDDVSRGCRARRRAAPQRAALVGPGRASWSSTSAGAAAGGRQHAAAARPRRAGPSAGCPQRHSTHPLPSGAPRLAP